MSTLKQRFAELAKLRPEITQAEIARAAGVKPPSVNGWFSGESKSMRAATATSVASLYGVSAHWLATGEGEMLPTLTQEPNRKHQSDASVTTEGKLIPVGGVGRGRLVPVVGMARLGDNGFYEDRNRPGAKKSR